ncbi:hypothetical protein ACA910_005836 [Epithemia clementina (nom. ined.)]
MFELIRGPLGNQDQEPRLRPKRILILSDSTGLMAKSAVEKTLAQFNGCGDERFFLVQQATDREAGDVGEEGDEEDDDDGYDESCENISTKLFPFLKSEAQIASILKQAAEGYDALVVYTFADPLLREQTRRMCQLSQLGQVDLLSPMFDAMSALLDQQPLGGNFGLETDDIGEKSNKYKTNGASNFDEGTVRSKSSSTKTRRSLSDKYFRRIEAVEYTLKCDDGKNAKDWHEADLILCGVSRTGKTPLSVVLAQTMGLKVANIPLVVDLPPPPQLFEVDSRRVIFLTLSMHDLIRIRRHRLRKMGNQGRGIARSTYADPEYLKRDLEHAKQLASEHGFTEIDVTGRAVEETASVISALLNRRFPEQGP